jgi:TP901 family phage tail tape measure protein
MAMAGWDSQKMLDGLSGVMNLAAAAGEELGVVSDIVTDAMTAFGMEASRANEFADVLAATSSKANTNVSMLGESFKYVAPVAGALGYSAQDTAIALGLMANAGIKGSQSGTALRATISRLVKPTKESGTSMNQLGISILDSEGKMKSLAEIIGDLRSSMRDLDPDQQAFHAAQIAGQEAMSGLLAIINTSEEDYNKLSNAINNADGTAQKMADTMQDNLAGKLTLLKSALEGVAIQIYDALQPALEILVAIIQKAVDAFANLSPGMQAAIVIIAGLAAAIGPLLILLGALSAAIGAISLPVVAVIAGIAALGAAIVGIYKLWKENGEKSKKLIAEFTAAIQRTLDNLKNWLSNTWNSIKQTASNVWNGIKSAILNPIESAKQTILDIITTIKNAFANMKIQIPKPKLPHISVTTKYKSVGDIKIPYPDFDLNWYKSGGIFDRPSVIGVGEAGTEAVIPLEKMPGLIADALRDAMGGSDQLAMAGGITVQNMYVRNDQDIKLVARELYNLQQTNARGRGLK